MDYSPSPPRQFSGDRPSRIYRDFSNESFEKTSSNIYQSPEKVFRLPRRGTDISEQDFDISYGGEPIPVHPAPWDTRDLIDSYGTQNASSRTLSPLGDEYMSEKYISSVFGVEGIEGIENDGRKAEEVEEAGLSWTVTLPADNEQSMRYTNITDSNSVWKVEKSYDKKIGTTSLQPIYSIKYAVDEMGQGKVTLFCPQGPIRDDEDLALVQARWLHVERPSMSVKVLEKLVMDCPLINGDIRRVAILLLEAVEKKFLRESENGAYIEPGSVLRFVGTRHMLHDSHNFVVTEPVVFVAFPFVELASSRHNRRSGERDEYYPRTLLQNLYGFDVVTSRGKRQVIHKMSASSQPDDTLFVNQLWCLLIGSDILITMSDRPADELLGDTIEKRTDYFRQPLRIEIVDRNGSQHSMSISSKTPWVDFFRHVMFTVHGNLIGIMDYELVDLANEVVTAERWVEIAKATKSSLLKFYLVERKTTVSRSSSVSSRRSSHSGIKKLLMLDYAVHDSRSNSKASTSRRRKDSYDEAVSFAKSLRKERPSRRRKDVYVEDSSSTERSMWVNRNRSRDARRLGSQQYPRSSVDTQWYRKPVVHKERQSGAKAKPYPEAGYFNDFPQSVTRIISLDSNDEEDSTNEGMSTALKDSRDAEENAEGAKDSHEDDASVPNLAMPLESQRLSSDENDEDIRHTRFASTHDHSLKHEQQPPANDPGESNTTAEEERTTPFEDNFSYLHDDQEQKVSEEEAQDGPMAKDAEHSAKDSGVQIGDDGLNEYQDSTASQPKKSATTYQKVTIEDEPELPDEDYSDTHAYDGPTRASSPDKITKVDFDHKVVLEYDEVDASYQAKSPEHSKRANTPGRGYIPRNDYKIRYNSSSGRSPSRPRSLSNTLPDDYYIRQGSSSGRLRSRSRALPNILRNEYKIRQNSSSREFRSRSSSLSSSADDSFYSRGRSRTRKGRTWSRDNIYLPRDSSSRPGVHFNSHEQYPSGRGNTEISPFGSSNATKVEALPVQAAVPFFCWTQSSTMGSFASQDTTEQMLIKRLDQIDELISDDPISKYYSKIPELTMDDVLSRQESLHEAVLERSPSVGQYKFGQLDNFAVQKTKDLRTDHISPNRPSESQAGTMNKASHENNDKGMEGFSINLDNFMATKLEAPGEDSKPISEDADNLTNNSPGRNSHEEMYFSQSQALGLTSHDKALVKQLVGMSQQIIWSFIPSTGGSVIHTLMKRLWGCVDVMCLQLLWEESQRGYDPERTYIIRNFSSQFKKTDLQRRKLLSKKIHYLDCDDCKAAKSYESAEDALDHLHAKHIDCLHNESERPHDDPCYVWLHRIWHDEYPVRSSRDGLLGIMEDFIKELSDISNYVRELHNMMARDSSMSESVSTPPLSVNITHTFQQIVKIFVFRSKQLSLINRRRSLASGSPFENVRLIQRIDRKIEELLSLEMDTNERIIDLLESAKKDIFLSGIGSHAEMFQAETVRVQFLALAFMSGAQRPLLQSSYIGRSYVRDTLLQLYNDYTSRLHFQANSRPQKRVFLDIHGLEEELQALDKLVDSQKTSLYNAMTLIDPLTSRYTTETRIREFRAELQYGNDHLRRLIERRREIDNLATRLWILKDQVKQTIEIMEEDHGKAIRVFTVVTLFFLPLSFVSSFLGMNTVDVRNSDYNQRIFWITGVPITVAVLSIAFIYGYKGEEIRDWMIHILQDRGHPYSSSAFGETNRDTGYRTSLETRWKEWNPATTANQNKRRDFRALIRDKMKRTSDRRLSISESFMKNDGSDGRVLIRRRNTEDSLAPMRRS